MNASLTEGCLLRCFAKIINRFQALTTFSKKFLLIIFWWNKTNRFFVCTNQIVKNLLVMLGMLLQKKFVDSATFSQNCIQKTNENNFYLWYSKMKQRRKSFKWVSKIFKFQNLLQDSNPLVLWVLLRQLFIYSINNTIN